MAVHSITIKDSLYLGIFLGVQHTFHVQRNTLYRTQKHKTQAVGLEARRPSTHSSLPPKKCWEDKEAPKTQYFGLNESVPHRLRYLNIQCLTVKLSGKVYPFWKASPHFQVSFCFLFAAEEVISLFPALAACCRVSPCVYYSLPLFFLPHLFLEP